MKRYLYRLIDLLEEDNSRLKEEVHSLQRHLSKNESHNMLIFSDIGDTIDIYNRKYIVVSKNRSTCEITIREGDTK